MALALVWANTTNDRIDFMEEGSANKDNQNAQNKQPIVSSLRCMEEELLYPGDQNNDWVCDCKPAYLYVPQQARCFQAYRQGPCATGKYLTLPPNSAIPICESNVCNRDGQVRFNGRCYALGTTGPCGLGELSSVIGVNETSLLVQCIIPSHLPQPSAALLHTRFDEDEDEQSTPTPLPKYCFNGSKRAHQNKC